MFFSFFVFQSFSFSELSFGGNYIDLIILVILAYFISEAWREGFWGVLADFLGFVISLLAALQLFPFVAEFLRSNFSLSHTLSNALGFLLVATLTEAILVNLFLNVLKRLPQKLWKKPWSSILAVIPAIGQGLVLVSFILTLAVALPVSPKVKADVTGSKIGGYLINKTSGIESGLKRVFGGLIEDSLTYMTVRPGSGKAVSLQAKPVSLNVDEKSQRELFGLVNEERKKHGLSELALRSEVIPIAQDHAFDMWERNYFGHVSPEGEDAGDRLTKAGVSFALAGENLALAPTVSTAHTGLMNSEGHRANILDPDFKRMGIGVVDNSYYGKIFVQIFTD